MASTSFTPMVTSATIQLEKGTRAKFSIFVIHIRKLSTSRKDLSMLELTLKTAANTSSDGFRSTLVLYAGTMK